MCMCWHMCEISVSIGKAIQLQAWTGPEGSRRLRFPDFKTVGTWRWQGCQPCAPAAFYPQEIFPVLISVRGWVDPRGHSAAGRIMSMENYSDTIGNRTRELLICSAVTQLRHRSMYYNIIILWDRRRICCPSLTETSLCGTWLYTKWVKLKCGHGCT